MFSDMVCVSKYPSVLSALAVQSVYPVHEAAHPLLQRVQRVVLGVMARETVPQTTQGLSDQLQLLPL